LISLAERRESCMPVAKKRDHSRQSARGNAKDEADACDTPSLDPIQQRHDDRSLLARARLARGAPMPCAL
jgi:hypothetical protein